MGVNKNMQKPTFLKSARLRKSWGFKTAISPVDSIVMGFQQDELVAITSNTDVYLPQAFLINSACRHASGEDPRAIMYFSTIHNIENFYIKLAEIATGIHANTVFDDRMAFLRLSSSLKGKRHSNKLIFSGIPFLSPEKMVDEIEESNIAEIAAIYIDSVENIYIPEQSILPEEKESYRLRQLKQISMAVNAPLFAGMTSLPADPVISKSITLDISRENPEVIMASIRGAGSSVNTEIPYNPEIGIFAVKQ